jgi:hypothetical protein
MWGQMRFDVYHHKDAPEDKSGKEGNGSHFNRARLFLRRDLSDKVSFEARWHAGKFDRYWVTANDFLGAQGLTFKAGQFYLDFEGRDNLYKTNNWQDDDAFFYDGTIRGVDLAYNRGAFQLELFYNSGFKDGAGENATGVYGDNKGDENYGARIAYNGAKFHASANAFFFNENGLGGLNYKAYYFALGFKPLKGFDLTGAYWMEKDINDDPKAWKVVLDVDQSVLKFTSLRAEYAKLDEGFYVQGAGPMVWSWMSKNAVNKAMVFDTKYFKVEGIQKWGSAGKFQTYERYAQVKADGEKAKELQLGIGFQYTPNLWLGVDYTKCDGLFKNGYVVDPNAEDKVVRFRTILSF